MKAIVFVLEEKSYAINISQISEVIRMREMTPIPDSADFVEGIISLHGKVIPIINLRKKIGIVAQQGTTQCRVIVVKVNNQLIGIIVDSVSDVVAFEDESVVPPDDVLKETVYLTGVVKSESKIILILDIEKLLSEDAQRSAEKIHKHVEVKRKASVDGKR